MRKVNNKIRAGMSLIIAVILIGAGLQWFFQDWVERLSVESKIALAVPLCIACLVGGYVILKGSTESTVVK